MSPTRARLRSRDGQCFNHLGGNRGVWELLFAHKIAITLFAAAVIDKPGAVQHVVVDGTLVVVTGIAYVLCRGWLTWQRASQPRLVD